MEYGSEEIDMQNYLKAGEKRALNLSNRGPIRFNKDGTLHKKIIDSLLNSFIWLLNFQHNHSTSNK